MRLLLVSLFFLIPTVAFAEPAIYLSSAHPIFAPGEQFSIDVLADTDSQTINAAEASLSFNPTVISVIGITTDTSVLQSWPAQPSYSNDTGKIKFAGWAQQKFKGKDGRLITITFRALRNAVSQLRFESGDLLAADGHESNILSTMQSGVVEILPKETPAPAEVSTPATTDSASSTQPGNPKTPLFTDYRPHVNAGERIVVKGSADPGALIHMTLQKNNDPVRNSDIDADDQGVFTYTSGDIAVSGTYRVWAQEELPGYRNSAPSNMIVITAGGSGVAAAAASGVDIAFGAVPYIGIAGIAGLMIGRWLHRRNMRELQQLYY